MLDVHTLDVLYAAGQKLAAQGAELVGGVGSEEADGGVVRVFRAAQQSALAEHVLHGCGDHRSGIDQLDAAAHDAGYGGGQQRIMRAAQHQCVDAGVLQRL